MTMSPMFNMMEATRLTREGRLTEVMALLQGARPWATPPRLRPTATTVTKHIKQTRVRRSTWYRRRNRPEVLGRYRLSAQALRLFNETTRGVR
jgi:hypothetical protein